MFRPNSSAGRMAGDSIKVRVDKIGMVGSEVEWRSSLLDIGRMVLILAVFHGGWLVELLRVMGSSVRIMMELRVDLFDEIGLGQDDLAVVGRSPSTGHHLGQLFTTD